MVQLNISLNAFISCYLILLQVFAAKCRDTLRPSVVQISQRKVYKCAGTLVRKNFVVTAAHCLPNGQATEDVTILAGALADGSGGVISAVSIISIPDSYNATTKDMDVAVLKLKSDVMGSNIRPTELCDLAWPYYSDVYAYAYTPPGPPYTSPATNLKSHRLIPCGKPFSKPCFPATTDHMIAASTLGTTIAVIRDSGGPVEVNGQFCGITSFGDEVVNRFKPIVFVNLAHRDLQKFINEELVK